MTNSLNGMMTNVTGQSGLSLPDKNVAEAERYLDKVLAELTDARNGLKSTETALQQQKEYVDAALKNIQALQQQRASALNHIDELTRRRREAIRQLDHASVFQELRDRERGVTNAWQPPTLIGPQPGGPMDAARLAASPTPGGVTHQAIDAAVPAAAKAWAAEQAEIARNYQLTIDQMARAAAASAAVATKPNEMSPETAAITTEESK